MADDLDPGLLSAVQGFEGFAPQAQWDYKQYTNGYGTKAAYPGEKISREDAQGRLQDELAQAQRHVDSLGVQMTPGWRNALTDFTYNVGPQWSQGSGLGDAVKAGNWDEAAKHLAEYNKAGGVVNPALIKRRTADLQMAGVDPALYQATIAQPAQPPRPPKDVPMSDTYGAPDQGALSQAAQQPRMSVWDSMGPALEKAAYFLMGPQAAGHALEVDRQQAEKQKKNFQVVGEDPWTGAKSYGFVNPYTGQITKPGQAVGGQPTPNTQGGPALAGTQAIQNSASPQSAVAAINAAKDRGVTDPEELLKASGLDPMTAQGVRELGNYQMDSGKFQRSKMAQPMGIIASSVYPGWDATAYSERQQLANGYGKENNQNQILAGNKALDHLDTLAKGTADAHLSDFGNKYTAGLVNDTYGFFHPQWQAQRDKNMQAATALSGETEKLFAGNTGASHERDRLLNQIGSARSATEAQAGLEGLRDLISGQMTTLRDHRNSVFNGVPEEQLDKRFPLYNPQEKLGSINRSLAAIKGTPAANAAAGASQPQQGAPKPGKYRYNPQTGNLDPM